MNLQGRKSEKGNVLFLILLAVVLFAALAYAVTSSMRGGGKDASDESLSTMASRVIQFSTLVQNLINRSMLVNNIPDYGFDFSADNNTVNANSTCNDTSCRVYTTSVRQGLTESFSLPAKFTATGTEQKNGLSSAAVVNIGTPKEDLLLIISALSEGLCRAINKLADINPDYTLKDYWGGTSSSAGGTLTSFPENGAKIGDQNPAFVNHPMGCFPHNSSGFVFYHVLIAR